MQKLAALLSLVLLAGCVFPGVYKINVQQGNIVDDETLAQLQKGMPREQVHAILGTPIMLNPVDDSREYYMYTFQKGGGDIKNQRVIVYYDGDSYTSYEAQLLDKTPAY
ncbi:outer membrane protein assembly factor BamE [Marinobacter halodurans]|uniref:Outer membrane protein assembly factor BamE n=1 Tax=Marinobacter halodurans TaxID=2528979 RepID=A0ABY1ZHA8_9GAMM|nr:outer membrane protein assembly factor BamE [Marinobacter halodurans]TBW52518.1 outer membrane protein assembly factor BamE [Marinobacter halodurans]